MITRWLRDSGNDADRILDAIRRARDAAPKSPIPGSPLIFCDRGSTMFIAADSPLLSKHLMALRRGSALWASYDRVLRDTARVELPHDVDQGACRTILELIEAVERGDTADPEEVQFAVRTILGCYPRPHIHDPEAMATMMGLMLVERPAGIVLMAADPRKGVPSRSKFPPSIAELTAIIDEISGKVLRARRGARRGLGLDSSIYAERG